MSGIPDFATYKSLRDNPSHRVRFSRGTIACSPGRPSSGWNVSSETSAAGPGAPAAAAVPTNATAGALSTRTSSRVQRVLRLIWETVACYGGMVTVADRLSHQGGLSGIVTTAQTTNLPTAALTRRTDGIGVMGALEIYTGLGTTPSTVSASYTNTAGVSGRTSEATTWGTSTVYNQQQRIVILPYQVGDKGMKSVESVTSPVSTGTAGNFGVTLFYPQFSVPIDCADRMGADFDMLSEMGFIPKFDDGACLFFIVHSNQTATNICQGELHIAEEP